jgi:hypothetical protein
LVQVRLAAAIIGIAYGAWGLYIGLFFRNAASLLSLNGQDPPIPGSVEITLVSALLIVSSLVNFVGFRVSFYVSAVISVVLLARFYVSYTEYLSGLNGVDLLVTAAFCAATVFLDMLEATRKSAVSEESHPLNLPVFG